VRLFERQRELSAVDTWLKHHEGILLIDGGAGLGKTSLVDAACRRAEELGYEVLRSHGSELEVEFAFGVVRQLFERRLTDVDRKDRDALLAGAAAAARPLLAGGAVDSTAADRSFAVLHGLYWLTSTLAALRPLVLVVDDAHWADEPSLRALAYLAARLEGMPACMLMALRAAEPAGTSRSLLTVQTKASVVVRPALLSEPAVGELARATLGDRASDRLVNAVWTASGGNPLYLTELLRSIELDQRAARAPDPSMLPPGGREGIARRVIARVRAIDPAALDLAQAIAVLGDDCELRQAAAIAGLEVATAARLAAGLARIDVLAEGAALRFIHPIVRDAFEASLPSDRRGAAHDAAARLLHAEGALAGRVAAHVARIDPSGDRWALQRLREAAKAAIDDGAPQAAANLLARALAEPPAPADRIVVLREAARAEASAGRETACARLDEALRLSGDPRERAEIALEVAEVYASLFRWTDAVDAIERALAGLGAAADALVSRLEGELVICGLHDARSAARVAPLLGRLACRADAGSSEALSVALGMRMVLTGRPAEESAVPLERALTGVTARPASWDTRAALLWSLITAERFDVVESALQPMLAEAHRTGSTRGFVATYSTLGLLKLRVGMLPEADTAARVALRVLQDGDFAPGLPFAATVLADVATEAGDLDESQALLALLPQEGWPAGVGTVLIPAARARLRLAQGRPAEALADFRICAAMFSAGIWKTEVRDVGYLHARSGAAEALLRMGDRQGARELAEAELSEVRQFGAPRALGIALRTAGLAEGGTAALERLASSVAALRRSPALLERARSLTELGAALRRNGQRTAAREPLTEALDLAARCGARPLAARAREELKTTGARPRRAWRTGVEALTPTELRIVRLAAAGRSNREIAQELYVTIKTVEGHLSRAYGKLGIEGRRQLARGLAAEKTRVPTR
jgi:DNA-binding CsgD family transcriptional regulator